MSDEQPAARVKYRYPTDEEYEAAWLETHRTHRVTENIDGEMECRTCASYWKRRKPRV